MKKHDIFDITKLILSLMVVAIHSQFFPKILYPWLRIAVPLFFLISSYLLYSKIKSSPDIERRSIIKNYIVRLIKYYLFWLIVLMPITIYVRMEWFEHGIVIGIINILTKPILGSTFVASWYIAATIIGTIIVEKLSSFLNYKVLLIFFCLIYLLCCFTSSYLFLFKNINFYNNIFVYIYTYIIQPQCSFPVSLIYILLGKIISEEKIHIGSKLNILFIILSCVLLYIEWKIVYVMNGSLNNDCYLFIMPTAVLVFYYIKNIKINIKNSRIIRQFSNFTYPFHASINRIINSVLCVVLSNDVLLGLSNFIITVIVCLLFFTLVKKLENMIKILKYSY